MKRFFLQSGIILFFFAFIFLQSCNKNEIIKEEVSSKYITENDYKYQTEYKNLYKTTGISANIIISADTKEELEYVTNNLKIRALYKKEDFNISENNIQNIDDNTYKENEKPKALIQLKNVQIPEDAIGYEIEGLYSTEKGWETGYAYDSQGIDGVFVQKTGKEKVNVRIGVKYTSSQNFFRNVVKATLKGYSYVAYYNDDYYVIRTKVKSKSSYIVRYRKNGTWISW